MTESDGGLPWSELNDVERIAHVYRDWDEEITISLKCGVSLVFDVYFGAWAVYGPKDAEPKDVIQPEKWGSAKLLLRYLRSLSDTSNKHNEPPEGWSQ